MGSTIWTYFSKAELVITTAEDLLSHYGLQGDLLATWYYTDYIRLFPS
jgi:hypothetical protein